MSKHTPGPWQHDELGIIYDRDGEPVQSGSEFVGGEPYANARLISLAPEMLDGLKMAAQSLRIAGMHESADRIESLISRAEGKI